MRTPDYVQQARASTGLTRFHTESFREGLDLLLAGFDASPFVTPGGRKFLDRWIHAALCNRLRLDDWLERHPEALDTPVEAPVFVVGLPRTGSSALHCVLGVDERLRVLWNWESEDLMPPATDLRDDPRIARRYAVWDKIVASGKVSPHPEMPEDPTECTQLMHQEFASLTFEHVVDNPAYRTWLYQEADMVRAMEGHRRNLQALQTGAPGRWLLKYPPHTLYLEAILAVYPDARFVVLHRDPLVASASYCSLIRFTRGFVTSVDDPAAVGEVVFPQLVEHTRRLMAFRDAHPEVPVLDVQHAGFVADPVRELGRIYAYVDLDFPVALQRRMLDDLRARRARGLGGHDYDLATFGIDEDDARAAFGDYVARYEVGVR